LFDCCQTEFYLVGVDLAEELYLDVLGVRILLEGLDPFVLYLVQVVLVSSSPRDVDFYSLSLVG
jgi:hypothetical protein